MEDLISREEVKKAIGKYLKSLIDKGIYEIDVVDCNAFLSNHVISDIPIAYDVDKVINQLEKKSFERYGNGGMGGELVVNLDDAFDIVKGGGLDE